MAAPYEVVVTGTSPRMAREQHRRLVLLSLCAVAVAVSLVACGGEP
jgi:hypothetical protein